MLTRSRPAYAVGDNRGLSPVIVAHELEAGGVDEIAVAVRHEGARTRQERRAVGVGHDEEAVALDREIGDGGRVVEDALLG